MLVVHIVRECYWRFVEDRDRLVLLLLDRCCRSMWLPTLPSSWIAVIRDDCSCDAISFTATWCHLIAALVVCYCLLLRFDAVLSHVSFVFYWERCSIIRSFLLFILLIAQVAAARAFCIPCCDHFRFVCLPYVLRRCLDKGVRNASGGRNHVGTVSETQW